MEEGLSGFCIKAASGNNGSTAGSNIGTKCGRWNPTTEQVKVLRDLFRSGLRTPSTDQIQKISNQLSFYGKIENKNVFYWFQNHKARERLKRRKLSLSFDDQNIISSSPKYYATEKTNHDEVFNQQPERVIETLELFPLNSYDQNEEKRRFHTNECYCKETTRDFDLCTIQTEIDYPPLDLCLSFL